MNPLLTLLKMSGIEPDQIMAEVDRLRALAAFVEESTKRLEEKQDRILALLEAQSKPTLQIGNINSNNALMNGASHDDIGH